MKKLIYLSLLFLFVSNILAQESSNDNELKGNYSHAISDSAAIEFRDVDVPPECLNLDIIRKTMKYPEKARDNDIEGKTMIKVLVDTTGDVIQLNEYTGNPIFYDEVSKACFKLKFSKASHNGVLVKCWVPVPFGFYLKH